MVFGGCVACDAREPSHGVNSRVDRSARFFGDRWVVRGRRKRRTLRPVIVCS
jgi:hypothetical protein